MLAPPRNDSLCHSLFVTPHTHAVILNTLFVILHTHVVILNTLSVIPHTNLVILSVAKNLVIGMIVSLLLPDPSTPLRCAQDDKGEEFSGRFGEDSVRAGSLGALSLTSLCFLSVFSLFPLCFLSDLSLSSPLCG